MVLYFAAQHKVLVFCFSLARTATLWIGEMGRSRKFESVGFSPFLLFFFHTIGLGRMDRAMNRIGFCAWRWWWWWWYFGLGGDVAA